MNLKKAMRGMMNWGLAAAKCGMAAAMQPSPNRISNRNSPGLEIPLSPVEQITSMFLIATKMCVWDFGHCPAANSHEHDGFRFEGSPISNFKSQIRYLQAK